MVFVFNAYELRASILGSQGCYFRLSQENVCIIKTIQFPEGYFGLPTWLLLLWTDKRGCRDVMRKSGVVDREEIETSKMIPLTFFPEKKITQLIPMYSNEY